MVTLHAMDGDDNELYYSSTVSFPDGYYVFDNVYITGVDHAYVSAAFDREGTGGPESLAGRTNDVEMGRGQTVFGNIVMSEEGLSQFHAVKGMVMDSFGRPYGSIDVTLSFRNTLDEELDTLETVTDLNGNFQFIDGSSLPAGTAYEYVTAHADLGGGTVIYGQSARFVIEYGQTSSASVVLHIPLPNGLSICADPNPAADGQDTVTVYAQATLNGLPYYRPGIAVTFSSDNGAVAEMPAVRTNLTNMKGITSVEVQRAGTGHATITAECFILAGYPLTASVPVYFSEAGTPLSTNYTTTLPETASVTGYVVDSYGRPYAGLPVKLSVYRSDGSEIFYTTTTSLPELPMPGAFVFDNVVIPADAAYERVSAEATISDAIVIKGSSEELVMTPGCTNSAAVVLNVPVPDGITIAADPQYILRGGDTTLLTAQLTLKGQPYRRSGVTVDFTTDSTDVGYLPGVHVNLTNAEGQTTIFLTSADMSGTVTATATTYVLGQTGWTTTTASVDVYVQNWGTIGGTVFDQSNTPVPNAMVSLKDQSGNHVWSPENPQNTVSRAEISPVGTYVFYRIPAGTYTVSWSKDSRSGEQSVTVGPGTATGVFSTDASLIFPGFTAAPAGYTTLYGIVLDKNKNAIPYANVTLYNTAYNSATDSWDTLTKVEMANNPTIAAAANTSSTGLYSFSMVPYGTYKVVADYNGHSYYAIVTLATSGHCAYIAIPDMVYRSPGSITLTADPSLLLVGGDTGIITAQLLRNGEPYRLAGVTVTFSTSDNDVGALPTVNTAVTDSNGQAQILLTTGSEAGSLSIWANANMGVYAFGSTDVVVSTWGTISGIVTDSVHTGIPNATVKLWTTSLVDGELRNVALYPLPDNPQLSAHDPNVVAVGTYEFSRVPSGIYNVTVEKTDRLGNHYLWYALVNVATGTSTTNVAIPDYVEPIKITMTANLEPGWNLVSVPLDNGTLMASDLEGTGVTTVATYNKATNGFDPYVVGVSPDSDDKEIIAGRAYFMLCNKDISLEIIGYAPLSPVAAISSGWNMIGWNSTHSSTAKDFAGMIPGNQVIARYDRATSGYTPYIEVSSPDTDSFVLQPGEAYFVLSDSARTIDFGGI